MTKSSNVTKLLAGLIIAVQLLDMAVHLSTNQVETLRLISNGVIFIWLLATLFGWVKGKAMWASLCAIGGYLLLNSLFLMEEGLYNDGVFRTMLFVFIGVTVALSLFFASKQS